MFYSAVNVYNSAVNIFYSTVNMFNSAMNIFIVQCVEGSLENKETQYTLSPSWFIRYRY
jgi:rRNA-processing protein FCF1